MSQCIGLVAGSRVRCRRAARKNSSWCIGHQPEKRAWVYLQRPREYEISGCPKCGNADPDWSEFAKHCWCPTCHLDYLPESNGVFDGPIPVHCSALMGILFDRMIIATGQIEIFDLSGEAESGWIPQVRAYEALRGGE